MNELNGDGEEGLLECIEMLETQTEARNTKAASDWACAAAKILFVDLKRESEARSYLLKARELDPESALVNDLMHQYFGETMKAEPNLAPRNRVVVGKLHVAHPRNDDSSGGSGTPSKLLPKPPTRDGLNASEW